MSIQRVAVIGAIAVVLSAVAAGLIFIGSPAEQRLLRLDERRVQDLVQMARVATNRWDQQRILPAEAADLVDGQWLTRLPADPTSRAPYEYRVTGPQAFELCAVFDRASRPEQTGDFWYHEAGRRCFALEANGRNRAF